MTVRELITELCKCKRLDKTVLINGLDIDRFDVNKRNIRSVSQTVKEESNPAPVNDEPYDYSGLREVLLAVKGERTMRKWGKDTGIAASYLCMLLKGKCVPSLKILKKIIGKGSFPRVKVPIKTLIKYAG
jgi:hypothetical protein